MAHSHSYYTMTEMHQVQWLGNVSFKYSKHLVHLLNQRYNGYLVTWSHFWVPHFSFTRWFPSHSAGYLGAIVIKRRERSKCNCNLNCSLMQKLGEREREKKYKLTHKPLLHNCTNEYKARSPLVSKLHHKHSLSGCFALSLSTPTSSTCLSCLMTVELEVSK